MYRYAGKHIPYYNRITTYPNDPEYNPNTNGVTNFSYAFYNMTSCKDSIESILNRFDWNSCTDMSYAFTSYKPTTYAKQMKLVGNIPYIPKNVVNLSYAFYQCKSLFIQQSLTFPNTIIDMSCAFTNLSGGYLPSSLPNKVVNISYAFSTIGRVSGFDTEYRCYGKIPNIPNTVKDMSYAFSSLGNVTGSIPIIPNSVINMSYAFYRCRNLTGSIPNIPNSVTDISGAFSSLDNVTGSIPIIPNNVTNMSAVFDECYNLTGSIPSIPNSVTNMSYAFSACYNLTGSIPNIPNSVSYMNSTFFNCYNLTGSIPNIPNSVIYMNATFYNCYKLSSSNVYIHSNNVSGALNCFYNMRNTMNIYVHANTKTYNTFYKAMGNSTYNSSWKCYLKTF